MTRDKTQLEPGRGTVLGPTELLWDEGVPITQLRSIAMYPSPPVPSLSLRCPTAPCPQPSHLLPALPVGPTRTGTRCSEPELR